MIINFAAVFFLAVEVDGNGAAAEIHIFAEIGITAVNEMRKLCAISNSRILHFYEVSDLYVIMKVGIWTKMNERSDFIIRADFAFMCINAVQMSKAAAGDICQLGIGTNDASFPNHGMTFKDRPRIKDGVSSHFYILSDICILRIYDADAFSHQFLCLAEAENPVCLSKLNA